MAPLEDVGAEGDDELLALLEEVGGEGVGEGEGALDPWADGEEVFGWWGELEEADPSLLEDEIAEAMRSEGAVVDSEHDGVVAEMVEEVGCEEGIDEGADVHVPAPPPEPYDAVVVWNGELPTVDAIRLLPDLPEGVTSRPNGIFMETEGGEVKLGVVNAVQDRFCRARAVTTARR